MAVPCLTPQFSGLLGCLSLTNQAGWQRWPRSESRLFHGWNKMIDESFLVFMETFIVLRLVKFCLARLVMIFILIGQMLSTKSLISLVSQIAAGAAAGRAAARAAGAAAGLEGSEVDDGAIPEVLRRCFCDVLVTFFRIKPLKKHVFVMFWVW